MTHHRKSYLETSVTKEPKKLSEEQRKNFKSPADQLSYFPCPRAGPSRTSSNVEVPWWVREEDDTHYQLNLQVFRKRKTRRSIHQSVLKRQPRTPSKRDFPV